MIEISKSDRPDFVSSSKYSKCSWQVFRFGVQGARGCPSCFHRSKQRIAQWERFTNTAEVSASRQADASSFPLEMTADWGKSWMSVWVVLPFGALQGKHRQRRLAHWICIVMTGYAWRTCLSKWYGTGGFRTHLLSITSSRKGRVFNSTILPKSKWPRCVVSFEVILLPIRKTERCPHRCLHNRR